MKIRSGYVSNSSSSSFLVKLPKDFIITPESIHALMFGCDESIQVEVYGDPFDSKDLAAIVAKDLISSTPNEFDKISEELLSVDDNSPDYDDFVIPSSPRDEDRYQFGHDQYRSANKLYSKKLMSLHQTESTQANTNTYILNYGDENGSVESTLEHGGFFDDFATRVSHH